MRLFSILLLFVSFSVIAQVRNFEPEISQRHQGDFDAAYNQYPEIPRGILEAIAYTNTRIRHIRHDIDEESCTGMPFSYGVMGLVLDGKNYFRNNLITVSQLSGISAKQIIESPEKNILAFASAYAALMEEKGISNADMKAHSEIITALSELPEYSENKGNNFALDSHLFSVLKFLSDQTKQQLYNFQNYHINMEVIFGEKNLKILSSSKVNISENQVKNSDGIEYELRNIKTACPDYPVSHCDWVASPNYSSRNGTTISAIAIHTVQGSYAGCVSWFQNTSASASTQYVVRSSDGQLTQMVLESNKAWHVTTENPYTIGYEHEGYVDDPSWYTNSMYQSSADLTRDICNRQGINPLRMFYRDTLDDGTVLDYGLHNLGAEGSCIKIKGHQHYPNQTHTDPGPNWYWDYYFRLVNENPAVTTLTSTTGNFYDTGGSSANYGDDERLLWLIQPANAEAITISFTSWDLEANYDFMYIYDGDNEFAPLIGRYNTISPGTITSSGGSLLIEFRSDCATNNAGWEANWTTTTLDVTAPTTIVTTPTEWVNTDFTASFTDEDDVDGTGVEKAFYQVIDYDGTEWRANASEGFYSDNFDGTSIHTDWTNVTGTWSISNDYLTQTNEAEDNTNIYTYLNSSLSNRYLYHWGGSISGTGVNRRGGFHYFCDQPDLTNRGNSYFIWFRIDDDAIQLYKVEDDVFSMIAQESYDFNAGQWYDFKIAYDRITGEHWAYINNELALNCTDLSPYSSGDYVSFRSGNSIMEVNNFKAYRSRYPSVDVTVGASGQARYQNANPSTPAARVKSIVQDGAGNLSAIDYSEVNIDWTAPSSVSVNDGSGADQDETYSTSQLFVNWTDATDNHSGINEYFYCIGDTPGGNNIVGWTSNGTSTAVTVNSLSLSVGTSYYASVKSINGASLESPIATSDGITVLTASGDPVADFSWSSTDICLGDSIYFTNTSVDASSYLWTITGTTTFTSTDENPVFKLTEGTYNVQLTAYGNSTSDAIEYAITVTENQLPEANFSALETTLHLPSATAYFTNASINADGYIWIFGDGDVSSDISPWHNYTDIGTYTVSLIAQSNYCKDDTLTISDYIQVLENEPLPEANFTIETTSICEGLPFVFTNESSNATSYFWNFGPDASPANSNEENPEVYYPSGTYNVQLIAYNNTGNDTTTQNITVTVSPSATAVFSAIETELTMDDPTAYFVNNSQNADSYVWLFGDGESTVDESPWHTYAQTGYYDVTLIAVNMLCDNDTMIIDNFIHIDQAPLAPIANFSYSTTTICEGESIIFTNLSENTDSVLWSFENGSPENSTEEMPAVILPEGFSNISITAYGDGMEDTYSQSVSVSFLPSPIAEFYATETYLQYPDSMVFFINNSQNADSYSWNFGDGSESSDVNPWHAYSDTGYYSVSLVAVNSTCPNDTLVMEDYIYIEGPNLISSVIENNVRIYPNPFTDHLVIEFNQPIEKVKIISVDGKIVYCQEKEAINRWVINLESELSSGNYQLQIFTNENTYNYKLVK